MNEIAPDFRELLDEFEREGVEYLLVGGYAVAFYGHPRYTSALDLWVRRSEENAERIARALNRAGERTSRALPPSCGSCGDEACGEPA